jgi:hypothetical protein
MDAVEYGGWMVQGYLKSACAESQKGYMIWLLCFTVVTREKIE